MKLYYSPAACSMAPHIALNELGLPFETIKVDLKAHQTEKGEDYYQINPKGYVPALRLDNGEILTENVAILTYLIDSKKGASAPAEEKSLTRYRRLEWLVFISTEIHKTLGALWDPTLLPQTAEALKNRAAKRFDFLDQHLAKQSFVLGNQFDSGPDSYLFTVLNWSGPLKIDLSRWPNIIKYMESIRSRPAVQKTMKEEGLIK